MIKKLFTFTLSIALLLVNLGCNGGKQVVINDINGNEICRLSGLNDLDSSNESYQSAVYVINEAAGILASLNNINEAKAKKLLFKKGYTINSTIDTDAVYSMCTTASSYSLNAQSYAYIELSGEIRGLYSTGDGNSVTTEHSPHSSFKPLSVYMQGIEKGIFNYSTTYTDSPYSRESVNGIEQDWPSNATKSYTYEKMTIQTAIKQSVNTIAVKALNDVGVINSIVFLKDAFALKLEFELQNAAAYGEDSVLGNIALGSLQTGVSVVQMAGFYTIFPNLGEYTQPYSVGSIELDGESVYAASPISKKIVSEETASLMNYLLQGVFESGGTASSSSKLRGLAGGKTGTGDLYSDCWFVGYTPDYAIGIWHDDSADENICPEIFASLYEQYKDTATNRFTYSKNIEKKLYCEESGLLLGDSCTRARVGYYMSGNLPDVCDGIH